MADKEVTLYLVDVGISMAERRHGRQETDLDWAMRYVWDRITSTMATGRKMWKVGVLGVRTNETSNDLDSEESFKHISVIQPIRQMVMPDLHILQEKLRPSDVDAGDAISALVVAIKMLDDYCKKLKYRRRIVLVTSGRACMDDDGVDEIARKVGADGIELTIVGLDFDDPDFGVKEEDKEPTKAANERLLHDLVERCQGVCRTMAQAIAELSIPRIKKVAPVPSFRGKLTLGDPSSSEKTTHIDVERYPRTAIARAPSASSFVLRSSTANADPGTQTTATMALGNHDTATTPSDLTALRSARMYQVPDAGAVGGKRDVDRDQLAKGYEYGRTAVHISPTDENITKLETHAGLEVMGFVVRSSYRRYMNMSTASMIVPAKGNPRASMALSSVIRSLDELDSYAIARLVTKDDRAPVIVLLAPSIESDYECLLDVQLPFAEDVRPYRFPPLDRIMTVSGKVVKEHRNLPNDSLRQAMSDYVDRMDLSTWGKDDQAVSKEYMAFENTFSPVLHRIDQAVRWRAVHPSDPIPPLDEILVRYSKPPDGLARRARPQLEKLMALAEIKKVPPKQKGRKRNRESVKPLSGLNVDELLNKERRSSTMTISANNAVPEFKQLLATTRDPNGIETASKLMSDIIRNKIRHSLGDEGYASALEALGVMRDQLIAYEEPKLYNDFVTELRSFVRDDVDGGLGGDRREMWYLIRKHRLGLINSLESELVDVTEDDARSFLLSNR